MSSPIWLSASSWCACGWRCYFDGINPTAAADNAHSEHKSQCPVPRPQLSDREIESLLMSLARDVAEEYGGTFIVRRDQ